jgi:hypothetical protein
MHDHVYVIKYVNSILNLNKDDSFLIRLITARRFTITLLSILEAIAEDPLGAQLNTCYRTSRIPTSSNSSAERGTTF